MGVVIRRLENNLTTLGTGVIAFGFWNFIKFALTYMIAGAEGVFGEMDDDIKTAVIITGWIISVLSVLIYLWIGLSARAEGNGKRKRILYLIMIGIIIFFSFIGIIIDLISLFTLSSAIVKVFVTLIIDLTRMVFLVEILYSSAKLRKLKKQQVAEEGTV